MSDPTSDQTSIPGKIAETLADQMVDQLAGKAVSGALQFIGINGDDDSSEIKSKLDLIVNILEDMKQEISDMRSAILNQTNHILYDGLISTINELNSSSETIRNLHLAILTEDEPGKSNSKKDLESHFTPNYLDGLNTWHLKLVGQAGSQSLLDVWNQACMLHRGRVIGPAFAYDIKRQWDFLDAHQAMLANFIVHHYLDTGQTTMAQQTIDTWHANRTVQLQRLRGASFSSDTIKVVTPDGKVTDVTTPVAQFDLSRGFAKTNGQWIAWGGTIASLNQAGPNVPKWWDVQALLASAGIDYNAQFCDVLRDHGFSVEAGLSAVWVQDGDGAYAFYEVGQGVVYGGQDPLTGQQYQPSGAAGVLELYGPITPEQVFWVNDLV